MSEMKVHSVECKGVYLCTIPSVGHAETTVFFVVLLRAEALPKRERRESWLRVL